MRYFGDGVKARLMRRSTVDGIVELESDVKIGAEYTIYPDSVQSGYWFNAEKLPEGYARRESVWAVNAKGDCGFMPIEMFDYSQRN